MNTAVINIKTQPEVKAKAKEIASELGISLSSLVDAFLKQFIKTKRVTFTVDEKPSKYLLALMKKANEDRKKGKASPIFDNAEEAIAWLHRNE